MPTVTGVKFRSPGKVYYFAPGELTLHYNDHVIVETIRGIEYGTVVLPTREVEEENLAAPLRVITVPPIINGGCPPCQLGIRSGRILIPLLTILALIARVRICAFRCRVVPSFM